MFVWHSLSDYKCCKNPYKTAGESSQMRAGSALLSKHDCFFFTPLLCWFSAKCAKRLNISICKNCCNSWPTVKLSDKMDQRTAKSYSFESMMSSFNRKLICGNDVIRKLSYFLELCFARRPNTVTQLFSLCSGFQTTEQQREIMETC